MCKTIAQTLNETLRPQLDAFSGNIGVSFVAADGSAAWHYHQNEVLPVASTMKLFVLGALLEQVQLGNCSLDAQITYAEGDIIGGSGLLLDMQAGTSLSAYNMALLMMLISDNTATNLLTDYMGGIAVVQAHMNRHGAQHTKINRKMSEDPAIMATGPFAVGTTAEYASYLLAVHRGEILNAAHITLFDAFMARQHYKNFVPELLPLAEDWEDCWLEPAPAQRAGQANAAQPAVQSEPAVQIAQPAVQSEPAALTNAAAYFTPPATMPVHAACKTGWMNGIRCDVGYLTIEGAEYAYAVLSGDCKDLRPNAQNEGTKLLNACGLAFYNAVRRT